MSTQEYIPTSFPYCSLSLELLGAMMLKPDFGPDMATFPPLPEIHSDTIRLQVFTHRSFFARPTHIFEDHPDDPSPDNEKYEHLGDTVLGLVVTSLMLEMYPGLRVGPSTKIRALIVGNATLADISMTYRLPRRLRLHPAQAITLLASTNVQADVFESFVGGLYIDQGLESVKNWLYKLFRPYVISAYKIVRVQHGLPAIPTPAPSRRSSASEGTVSSPFMTLYPAASFSDSMAGALQGHLALFNQHLQKTNREVEWVYSDSDLYGESPTETLPTANNPTNKPTRARGAKTTPVWTVRVMVDGQQFGTGKGNTKKAAKNEAAKEGLEKMGIAVW